MIERSTSEVLVALLCADLGTGPAPDADAFDACDWGRFERLALHHGLIPILYKGLQHLATVVAVDLFQRMRIAALGNVPQNRLKRASGGAAARPPGISKTHDVPRQPVDEPTRAALGARPAARRTISRGSLPGWSGLSGLLLGLRVQKG